MIIESLIDDIGKDKGLIELALILTLLYYGALTVAQYRLFQKAGEKGWKALIPFYSMFVSHHLIGMRHIWFILDIIFWSIEIVLEFIEGTPAWIEEAFFSIALILTIISEILHIMKLCYCYTKSELFGIGFGTFQLIVNAIILAVVFALDRSQIGIGTVINMVAVGYLIEFFLWVLGDTPFLPGIAGMVLHLVLGTLLFTLGVSMYLKTRMGVSPIDAVAPIAVERTGRPYLVCRLTQDVLVAFIALITGGPIGIFTVVAALGTGPLITMWNKLATLNLYRRFKILNKQELAREAA